MSSILRTIDCNNTIRVRDYVKFNGDKLGYVKRIINTVSVRVAEAGLKGLGITQYERTCASLFH